MIKQTKMKNNIKKQENCWNLFKGINTLSSISAKVLQTFLKLDKRRTQKPGPENEKFRTIYKALYPWEEEDDAYISRKRIWELCGYNNSYPWRIYKMRKKKIIIAANNSINKNNTRTIRKSENKNGEKNNYMVISNWRWLGKLRLYCMR